MPWTGSRSRDEWLAEVRRRGERIRRRRRLALTLAGLIALAVPLAAATALVGGAGHPVQVSVAGPAVPPASTAQGPGPPTPADGLETAPAVGADGSASPGTTVEIHRRIAAINGSAGPATGDTLDVRAVHDRPAPPAAVADNLLPCPPAEVRVTVATDKAVYAPGETVHAVSILANRSADACRVPARAHVVQIEDGSGRLVRSFPMTLDLRVPVAAQPGASFTTGFDWDQQDCSGSRCVPAPPGTYVAVAEWAEGAGPYVARASFQIGP